MKFHGVMAIVRVHDIDRALRFYRDVLGFTVQAEQEEWIVFHEGIGLHVAPDPVLETNFNVNAVLVTLLVTNVQQSYNELTALGVPFFLPPTQDGGITFATFRDTENNLVQLMQLE